MQPVFSSPGTSPSRVRRLRGFTLIEIMITIAILAVIAAIALPAYTEQVRKARRAEAISTIMAAAQYLERCYTQTNSYTGCTAPTGMTQDGFYQITVPSIDEDSFTIRATPQSAHASDPCGSYTLTNLGQKGNLDTETGAARCWGTN